MLTEAELRLRLKRDVSDEPRDALGQWTDGGGTDLLPNRDAYTNARVRARMDEAQRQGEIESAREALLRRQEDEAVGWYMGPSNAQSLNDALRHGEQLTSEQGDYLSRIDDAIARQTFRDDPPVGNVLYKGMVTTHEFKVGDRFVDHGFGSTSTDYGIARQFAEGFLAPDKNGESVVMHISITPTKQHYVDGAAMIDEKILPRDMEYEVTKVVPPYGGLTSKEDPIRVFVKATPK